MPVDSAVALFCQMEIIDSGLILDEDLLILHTIEHTDVNPFRISITQGIVVVGTAIGTALNVIRNGNTGRSLKIGVLLTVPAASSLIFSYYLMRKAERQKKAISNLLHEFTNLSRIHAEVNDFVKQYQYIMTTSSDSILKQSEKDIQDLSEYTCDIEGIITNELQRVIKNIHIGLRDITLDLEAFQQITSFDLRYETISECIRNISFLEGQVVLLRSHLLTSVVLASSNKGDPAVFEKLLDDDMPSLILFMKEAIINIRQKLDTVRYHNESASLMSLSKMENIVGQSRCISMPRMRKHIIKTNNSICFTMRKLRTVLQTLETVESESQMVELQETLASVTQELIKCCKSSADLEKFIQMIVNNRTQQNRAISNSAERPEDDSPSTYQAPQPTSSADQQATASGAGQHENDSDYQVYGNYTDDSDEESELNAVRFYKEHINSTVDWLAELRQSEVFQRRQYRFNSGGIVTSTPNQRDLDEAGPSGCVRQHLPSISMESIEISRTSSGDLVPLAIPVPPPIPHHVQYTNPEVQAENVVPYAIPLPPPAEIQAENVPFAIPVPPPIPHHVQYANPEAEVQAENVVPYAIPLPPPAEIQAENEPHVEDSFLLNALRGVLDTMAPQEEEEFQ